MLRNFQDVAQRCSVTTLPQLGWYHHQIKQRSVIENHMLFPVDDEAPAGVYHLAVNGLIIGHKFIVLVEDLQVEQLQNNHKESGGENDLDDAAPDRMEIIHV